MPSDLPSSANNANVIEIAESRVPTYQPAPIPTIPISISLLTNAFFGRDESLGVTFS